VSRLDWEVGRILSALDALHIATNTLVIFASDNGSMNEGGYQRTWFNSSGPLGGGKRDVTEGGIRVPLIAVWPGITPAGKSSSHISAFWDFLPTVCDIAGVETPKGLDGLSYLPTLLGNVEGQKPHDHLYWEFHEQGGKRALRLGPWKAIQVNVNSASPGDIELYNLDSDPAESRNIAGEHPDMVDRARGIFAAAHTPSATWSWSPTIHLRKPAGASDDP
jgi:arylsulfatase A